ncbi:MAG: IS66 family transposase [Gammaproteobacteria bacterium]
MTHPGIHTLFTDVGLVISEGQVCALLTLGHERFHEEASRVALAGLRSSRWQHLDQTPTGVKGKEWACHVLGNPLYTAYRTLQKKERLCVLDALRAGKPRAFRIDAVALSYLEAVGVSLKVRRQVAALPQPPEEEGEWDEATFRALLAEQMPRAGPQVQQRVLEAGLLAATVADPELPWIDTLVCDDAPQMAGVTPHVMLCWVHEGRHYKKLCPYLAVHREAVSQFRERFWEYYRELAAYRQQPSAALAQRLREQFDTLFGTVTGYELLDERIRRTREKKADLLRVLEHPELPLNNNAAELGARGRVRKRDVSFGARSEAGVRAWDTYQTLCATAKKLGISFYGFVHDRVSETNALPELSEVIDERAGPLKLSASWDTT